MSEAVKEMLTGDIKLKHELISEFKKIAKRLILIMVFIWACSLFGFIYYSKSKDIVFDAIQKERQLIKMQRDSLRFEKEIIHGLKTKNPYSKPRYDTIK